MPALPSPSTWRQHPAHLRGYLWVYKPTVIFRRVVNIPSGITYPVNAIPYTIGSGSDVGAYTDVGTNATVTIKTSGGVIKGRLRTSSHAASSATEIATEGFSKGRLELANGDLIEVSDDRYLWSYPPFIDGDGNQFLDSTLAFASQELAPVANAGPYYAGHVSGGAVLVDFDGSNSFAVAEGATITGYSWDFKDGTPSSAATATVNNVSFPAGVRWVSLTVTDSNGTTATAYALVIAADQSTNAPMRVGVNTLAGDIDNGWSASFALLEDDLTAIPAGALVVYWQDEQHGATAGALNGYPDREQVKFVGFVDATNEAVSARLDDYIINCTGPLGQLRRLTAYPNIFVRDASPSSWNYIAGLTWFRYVIALAQRYSNWLELFDLEEPNFTGDYPLERLGATGGSLYDQLTTAASYVLSRFTCDKAGRFYIRRHPSLAPAAERASIPTTVTLAATDYASQAQVNELANPLVGSIRGYGFTASATNQEAKGSIAPGTRPGQGLGQQVLNNILVADQTALNQLTGDQLALTNNLVTGTQIEVFLIGLIADPAWLEHIKFDSLASGKSDLSFDSNNNWLLTQISVTFDARLGVASEQWTLDRVTQGTPGITVLIPDNDEDGSGGFDDNPPPDWMLPPIIPPPNIDVLPGDDKDPKEEFSGGAIAWTVDSILHCADVYSDNPVWDVIYTAKTDSLRAGLVRLDSPGRTVSGGVIKMWIEEGGSPSASAGFYYNADALGAGSWTKIGSDDGFQLCRPVWFDYSKVVMWDDASARDTSGYIAVDVIDDTTITDQYDIASSAIAAEVGVDVGDFSNVGFIWLGRNTNTLSYLDALSSGVLKDVDFSGVGGNPAGVIKCVRTPYRIWSTNALNNTATAVDVAVATEQALYLCTINTNTDTALFKVDRTPTVIGSTYGPTNPDGFAMRAGNPNYMIMGALENGGSTKRVILSTDGGQNWLNILDGVDLDVVQWAGKDSFWAVGEALYHFTELGDLAYDRTGNLFEKTNGNDIRGLELIA